MSDSQTIQVSLKQQHSLQRLIQPWQMNMDYLKVAELNKAVKSYASFFYLSPVFRLLTKVPNLSTLVRCPHPMFGLLLEWFIIASWIAFKKIPQEDPRANSFNLHVCLDKRHNHIVRMLAIAKEWEWTIKQCVHRRYLGVQRVFCKANM